VSEPLDIADVLVTTVAAIDTAISIADATDPDLPLIYVNPAFERLTGYRYEDVIGRNARFMQGPDTDRHTVSAIRETLGRGDFTKARLVNYRADGNPFWAELHISPVRDADGRVLRFAAVQHDVTPDVLAQQEAVRVAARDPLTTLTTRAMFGEDLRRELARAHRTGTAAAVLFLDVDDFKAVNDTYGHLIGDAYLIHFAECLRQRLRGQDSCARVGGDEFTALLTDLVGDGVEGSAHVVADLQRALAAPFTVDGVEHLARVTIGTALYPRDGATVRDLLAAADADMYRHKPPRGARPD
jgi:diguanylate cyclase (GGDEF)-like protein/PAS domain S-box-containing protein